MKTLKIYPTSINERFLQQIAETLRDGGLVIYPTDTVYAIGCDALNNRAIERICKIKGINPQKQQLSIVCSDISQASDYAKIDNNAYSLMRRYLPGAVTFVLPASTSLPKVFKGRRTVGIRVPDNPIARALAEALGNPVLSTSVEFDPENPDFQMTPHDLSLKYMNDVDIVIDGGECDNQLSTVVDCTDSSDPTIIRQGKVDFEA